MMLKSLTTSGGNGIGFPAVTGKAASKANKSTSKKDRTPNQPATHKIANSLVLALIKELEAIIEELKKKT